jgi:hypothetical protein
MRSEVVFEALRTTSRYTLCHLAFKAIRKLHNPSHRIQDTTNDVFQRLADVGRQEVLVRPENDAEGLEIGPEQCAVEA